MTPARRADNFDRTPIDPDRVRHIDGSFAFIPHRFLRDGFWARLDHRELQLYILLVLVADRHGMSFYKDDRLASILRLVLDHFLSARTGLLRKNLLAYDPAGPRYQVLSLPPLPVSHAVPAHSSSGPSSASSAKNVSHILSDFLTRLDDSKS